MNDLYVHVACVDHCEERCVHSERSAVDDVRRGSEHGQACAGDKIVWSGTLLSNSRKQIAVLSDDVELVDYAILTLLSVFGYNLA